MATAGIVTIVLVVVAIVVVALFLIRIGTVLSAISSSLTAVIRAVASIPERTEPIEPVLASINHDLGIARGVLEDLLKRKLSPPEAPARIVRQRPFEAEAAPGPERESEPVREAEPSRIVYQRTFDPAAAPEPERESEPELEAEPDAARERPHFSDGRIIYRHETPVGVGVAPARTASADPPDEDTAPHDARSTVIRYRRAGH